jgi:DnaK suppressor protein
MLFVSMLKGFGFLGESQKNTDNTPTNEKARPSVALQPARQASTAPPDSDAGVASTVVNPSKALHKKTTQMKKTGDAPATTGPIAANMKPISSTGTGITRKKLSLSSPSTVTASVSAVAPSVSKESVNADKSAVRAKAAKSPTSVMAAGAAASSEQDLESVASRKAAKTSATKPAASAVELEAAGGAVAATAMGGAEPVQVADAALVVASTQQADSTPAVAVRKGRKPVAAAVPAPQPKPSHAPDAAKATFSSTNERPQAAIVHTPARKDAKLADNWKSKAVDELTDDEVLSMPDSEYMNESQMAFFRLKLSRLKEDILSNAGQTTDNLREDTIVVPDPADRATIEEEHALELRTRDRERKLLKKIEHSIARIDSGESGYCDETGEAIGVGRLIARPTANLSLEAQQRRELKQKMFGD